MENHIATKLNKKKSEKVSDLLNKINIKSKSKIILEKYDSDDENRDLSNNESLDQISESETDQIDKIEQLEQLDQMDELEKELELKYCKNLPKNYGSKWTETEIQIVLDKIKKGEPKDLTEYDSTIKKLAKKLSRTTGGVFTMLKKIVFEKYLNGQNPEIIGTELNITFRSVKSIIKIFLIYDSDDTINLLEKENKLLKLKIDNIKLKKELNSLQ